MDKLLSFFRLSKRQKFVLTIIVLTFGIFLSEYLSGIYLIILSFILSFITIFLLYAALRDDVKGNFYYPILILPFLFTLAFTLFFPLVPARLITRAILTSIYAFGLYSLFLTQNIFVVSAIRTINLLRSARIVSFIISLVVLFLLSNIVFSLRLPLYVSPFIIFAISGLLNFQSLWTYSLSKESVGESILFSVLVSLCIAELSLILSLWPIDASIYSIFITGIFYSYSGLTHAWIEKRLFKSLLWEYVWVGFLAVLLLIFFSKWGL